MLNFMPTVYLMTEKGNRREMTFGISKTRKSIVVKLSRFTVKSLFVTIESVSSVCKTLVSRLNHEVMLASISDRY